MPAGDVAGIAATAGALLLLNQRLVRMPRRNIVIDDRRAVAQRLRCRSVGLDCHNQLLFLSLVVSRLSFAIHSGPRCFWPTTND